MKSPTEILLEELEKMFYELNKDEEYVDRLWQEYQVDVIGRFGEVE
jgi:hypothetical protein